jgi:hypothetical protein
MVFINGFAGLPGPVLYGCACATSVLQQCNSSVTTALYDRTVQQQCYSIATVKVSDSHRKGFR